MSCDSNSTRRLLQSNKKSDSSVDEFDQVEPTVSVSSNQAVKTGSENLLTSIDNAEFDNKVEFGSLNELKVRSHRPRMGVKAGRHMSRSKYDRTPIEVASAPGYSIELFFFCSEPLSGLYVIGSQECQYTPKGGSSSNCKDDWITALSRHLGNDYIQVSV